MIDGEKLISNIEARCNPYGKPDLDYDTSLKIIGIIKRMMAYSLPEAWWTECRNYMGERDGWYRCSRCHKANRDATMFCPHCGARMEI